MTITDYHYIKFLSFELDIKLQVKIIRNPDTGGWRIEDIEILELTRVDECPVPAWLLLLIESNIEIGKFHVAETFITQAQNIYESRKEDYELRNVDH